MEELEKLKKKNKTIFCGIIIILILIIIIILLILQNLNYPIPRDSNGNMELELFNSMLSSYKGENKTSKEINELIKTCNDINNGSTVVLNRYVSINGKSPNSFIVNNNSTYGVYYKEGEDGYIDKIFIIEYQK